MHRQAHYNPEAKYLMHSLSDRWWTQEPPVSLCSFAPIGLFATSVLTSIDMARPDSEPIRQTGYQRRWKEIHQKLNSGQRNENNKTLNYLKCSENKII